ncbi:MAG TPA: potassium transporter TrkG [Enhygromyxa sp.]|nr:potassium transporter TrkG [Enhygromyxa sp.]
MVPTLLEIAAAAEREAGYDALPGLLPIAILIAALLLDAALVLARRPALGRALLVLGGSGFAVLATVGLRAHPAQALALLLGAVIFGAWIYFAPEAGEPGHTLRNSRIARARMAAIGNVVAVFLLVGFRISDEPSSLIYVVASIAIALVLTLRSVPRVRLRWADLSVVVAVLISAAAVVLLRERSELAMFATLPVPIALLSSMRGRFIRDPLYEAGWFDLLLEQPARLLVGTFLLTGLAGAVVLSLPISATGPRVLLLDAAFTSFSATCVTGLVVLDTATAFSRAGQGTILALIQIGGLGIMTFSTAAMVLLGQRLTLRHEGAAIELLGGDRRTGLHVALRRVLIVTGVSELLGAALLTGLFRLHGDGWLDAAWRGLFTAISAFCNAGFAIQSDNLISYQNNPLILHTIGLLIIVGGLGPAVVLAIPGALLRRRRASLHARIVLITTAILLVVPAILIGALEWNHSLVGLGTAARLHNAWFQSLTTRTAGFNSVDFAAMTPATHTLVEALMFIGGSPGSTAGGIKTTTLFVLVFAVVAVTRHQPVVVWGGWTIPHSTVFRAAAIVTLGASSVVFGVFMIELTQSMDTQRAIFEVVSALGTVGLSIGGTGALDSVGKQIIIVCMFMGRVAPLTLFLIFNRPVRQDGTWTYPEQDVSVG